MFRFSLNYQEENHPKGRWTFEPFKDGMNLRDPAGKVVCWFAHRDAEGRFALPSFWRSIKKIGFQLNGGSTLSFEPEREAVSAVKDYLDEALASQGIEALDRMSKKGWLNFLSGIALLVVSVGLFALFKVLEFRRGAFYAPAGLFILGLGQTAWGIHTVFRVGKLRRRLRKSEQQEYD
jgi:hypothetical protein